MTDFTQHLGATVEWCGEEGRIDYQLTDNPVYPIQVHFRASKSEVFTRDGKFSTHHTVPSLKLVKPVRQKKHFVKWLAIGLYENVISIENSEHDARRIWEGRRTICDIIPVEFDAYTEPEGEEQ